ncbi:MAG: SPFH domain-containing protein [Desulfobacterales bacterium]|jgi:regulator of protease activity HflC (stomatin/prohibitin superfamily)
MALRRKKSSSESDDVAKDQKPAKKQSPWKIRFRILIGLIIIGGLSSTFMLQYVKPNEFGIKVVRIGIERGVQKKVYPAGFHFVLPFGFEEMHRLPKNIQVLELTNHPRSAAKSTRIEKAAHIQTSDGFFVDVDVSILYRIADPYKVFTIIGPGDSFEQNGIIPQAAPKLKDAMGELTTEEFYNSPLRVEKTEAAKEMLNKALNPKGLKVEQVLVRYFTYSREIQKNIEEKKLKDQLVFKNQAEARAAVEEAALKKIEQEGKAAVRVELEKGKAYITQRTAERDLYVRKKKAEADLLVQLAESERVRLKNDAMQGVGAERMVGLEMAEVFRGLDTVVLSSDGPAGVNPLDLDNALKLFDVRKGGSQ